MRKTGSAAARITKYAVMLLAGLIGVNAYALPSAADDPIKFYVESIENNGSADSKAVTDGLKRQLETNTTEKNFEQALVFAESLNAFDAISAVDLNKAYALYAQNIAETSSPGVALAMIGLSVNPVLLENDLLRYFLQLAIENKSLVPLKKLIEAADAKGLDTTTAKELTATVYSRSDWIKGSVMITIDQGFTKRYGQIIPKTNLGSGFFIDKKGYIVTNYHVIAALTEPQQRGFAQLSVQLWNSAGERIPAELIGYSKTNDIALLKAGTSSDYIFSFAQDDQVSVGEEVFAIGAPGGLSSTLTSGLVSNASRALMPVGDVMQIDAAVNPGNSGGPLVNGRGEVLGIVFAGIEQFQGVNFALPADLAAALLPRLTKKGEAALPFLAMATHDWSTYQEIIYIQDDSPAVKNGLKKGDTLLSLAGKSLKNRVSYQKYLLQKPVGALIKIGWQASRSHTDHEALILIERRPREIGRQLLQKSPLESLFAPLFGMDVERISRRQYIINKVFPATVASQNRFNKGDSFQLTRHKLVSLDPDTEVMLINIRSIIRAQGALESPGGLQIYAFFNQNIWL
jgi:serine protease Do